jgi:hypothetical protein
VSLGIFTAADAAAVRAEGERVSAEHPCDRLGGLAPLTQQAMPGVRPLACPEEPRSATLLRLPPVIRARRGSTGSSPNRPCLGSDP